MNTNRSTLVYIYMNIQSKVQSNIKIKHNERRVYIRERLYSPAEELSPTFVVYFALSVMLASFGAADVFYRFLTRDDA